MAAAITPKDPVEVLPYFFDFTDWLEPGDSLATAVVTLPAGLTLQLGLNQSNCVIVGARVVFIAAGGVGGTTYKCRCQVTTAQGYTGVGTLALLVRAA